MVSGLRPFVSIPRDIREWTRWTKEALIDGSVGTDQIEDGAVTLGKLANLAALSVIGNATGSTATPSAITASSNDRILSRTSGALGFTQLTSGMFPNGVVPDAALSATISTITTGSYTGTLTGCTTSPTLSITYRLVGGLVALNFTAALIAVSNTNACTVTGAPAAISPAVSKRCIAIITDNSATAFGTATMDSSGVLTLGVGAAAAAFTAANNKGIGPGVLVYPL